MRRARWRAAVPVALGALVGAGVVTAAAPASAAPAAAAIGIRPATGGLDSAFLTVGRISLAKADAPVAMPGQSFRTYALEQQRIVGDAQISHSPAWVVTTAGRSPSYGRFAPVTVTGHAGSTPVSVTLQQVQTVDAASRTWQPLDIRSVTAGGHDDVLVTGTTVLVVTAVTVGFRSTAAVTAGSAGARCGTVAPIEVRLTGAPGFSLVTGGVLRGGFDLPAFSGCAVGGSDLDAALTAALSGPGNRVTLSRGGVGAWNPRRPDDCDGCTEPPPLP